MRRAVRRLAVALLLLASGCATATPRRGTASFAGGTSVLPISQDWEGRLVSVPITVNDVHAPAILDTGASYTVIERTFAERLRVALGGRRVIHGVGGDSEARHAAGVRLRIGSLALDGLETYVLDLSRTEEMVGRAVPVILGEDLFQAAVVEFDAAAKVVRLHDPVRFAPPANATRVAIENAQGLRTLEVSVEGKPVRVVLDTGSAAALTLHPSWWRGNVTLEGRIVSSGVATGVGGTCESSRCTLRTLALGGTVLAEVPVDLGAGAVKSLPSGASGLLGFPVLRRFRFFVDYPHAALWLVPDRAALAEPFERGGAGLAIVKEADALRIFHVAARGPGEAAGFRVGDRIATIDGRPAAVWTQGELRELVHRPAGTVLTFTMTDGTTRRVVIRDYY